MFPHNNFSEHSDNFGSASVHGRTREGLQEIFNTLVQELRVDTPFTWRLTGKFTPGGRLRDFLSSFYVSRSANHLPDTGGQLLLTEEAINCIYDEIRTKKFIEAIEVRTRTVLERESSPHVLDAGCGPLPLLSIAAAFVDPSVKVTALEFNKRSAAIATEVVREMGLAEQITVLHADASTFIPQDKIDVLVSETIAKGLMNEPLVAIMSNLARFMNDEGFIIPESVTVKLGVIAFEPNAYSAPDDLTERMQGAISHYEWLGDCVYKSGAPLPLIQIGCQATNSWDITQEVCLGMEVNTGINILSDFESQFTYPLKVRNSFGSENMSIPSGGSAIICVFYTPGATNQQSTFMRC